MMPRKLLLWISFAAVLTGCDRLSHYRVQGYVEGENIYLSSPFSGLLKELPMARGMRVSKGQMLFRLDENPQAFVIKQTQSELQQAQSILSDLQKPRRLPEIAAIQAQIDQTDAQIKLAEIRLDRMQKLYAKRAIDKDSVDAAEAHLKQQRELKSQFEENLTLARQGSREDLIAAQNNQISALEERLKQAQWDLQQKTMVAPASGVIFDTYFRTGELVGAQQPVLALLTPENVRIEFFIPLEVLERIQLGQEVTFDCDHCTSDNKAIVSYISPEAEYVPPLVYSRDNYSKLVYRIKARIKNPEAFKPGQPVTVSF